jgi:DNA repair exonuclease SbcCD ATPase subunit
MEAQIRALEEKLAEAASPPEAGRQTTGRGGPDRDAASELERSNEELTKAKAEFQNTLAELESAWAKLGTTETALGSAHAELDTAKDRLAEVEAERDAFRARVAGLEATLAEAELALTSAAATAQAQPAPTDANVVSVFERRAIDAERRLLESEERFADSHARLAESDARLAEALARLEGSELARSNLEGDAGSDLAARIAELEKARRADIEEMHRVQESFANTQVEFTNTTKKLREAERRIRELEGDNGVRRHGAPTYVPAVADGGTPEPGRTPPVPEVRPVDLDSFEERVSSLRAGLAAANDLSWDLDREASIDQLPEHGLPPMPPPQPDREPEREPDAEPDSDPEEEGLSLRERLARAAAARHRGPLA